MYFLDSYKEVKIFNLVFQDSYSTIILTPTTRNLEQCLDQVDKIIESLESSTVLGFLSTVNLRNFPIISELIQPFLLSVDENEVEEYICGDKSMETYK